MAEMIFLEPDDHRRYKNLWRTYPVYFLHLLTKKPDTDTQTWLG